MRELFTFFSALPVCWETTAEWKRKEEDPVWTKVRQQANFVFKPQRPTEREMETRRALFYGSKFIGLCCLDSQCFYFSFLGLMFLDNYINSKRKLHNFRVYETNPQESVPNLHPCLSQSVGSQLIPIDGNNELVWQRSLQNKCLSEFSAATQSLGVLECGKEQDLPKAIIHVSFFFFTLSHEHPASMRRREAFSQMWQR